MRTEKEERSALVRTIRCLSQCSESGDLELEKTNILNLIRGFILPNRIWRPGIRINKHFEVDEELYSAKSKRHSFSVLQLSD